MSKYTEKDAAKDTDVPISEVKKAWHDARDDAMHSGELDERAANKDREIARRKNNETIEEVDPVEDAAGQPDNLAEIDEIENLEPVEENTSHEQEETVEKLEDQPESVEELTSESAEPGPEPKNEPTQQDAQELKEVGGD
jgi:hypothetical protein